MPAILACCVLSAVFGAVGLLASSPDDATMRALFVGVLVCASLQAVGAAAIAAGRRRAGAVVAIVGSLPLFPLGLLGAWGARTVLDGVAREDFERRRSAHG